MYIKSFLFRENPLIHLNDLFSKEKNLTFCHFIIFSNDNSFEDRFHMWKHTLGWRNLDEIHHIGMTACRFGGCGEGVVTHGFWHTRLSSQKHSAELWILGLGVDWEMVRMEPQDWRWLMLRLACSSPRSTDIGQDSRSPKCLQLGSCFYMVSLSSTIPCQWILLRNSVSLLWFLITMLFIGEPVYV